MFSQCCADLLYMTQTHIVYICRKQLGICQFVLPPLVKAPLQLQFTTLVFCNQGCWFACGGSWNSCHKWYTLARLHKRGWWITKCQQAAFSSHEATSSNSVHSVPEVERSEVGTGCSVGKMQLKSCRLIMAGMSNTTLNWLSCIIKLGLQITIFPIFSQADLNNLRFVFFTNRFPPDHLCSLIVFSSVLPWLVKTSPSARTSPNLTCQSWMSVT